MSNTSLLGSFGGQDNSALMFRNRLINAGSFDIWQRGTSFSSLASGVYTADRWLTDGAVTTVARSGSQNNVMQVITQAGTGIAQRIETNAGGFFAGQTYTVSGLVNCSVADLTVIVTYRAGNTFKSTIHNANVSSQLTANTYSRFTTTFTLANAPTDFAGTDCIQVSFISSVVNTINFQSAQFEAGPTATPFERRPIGVELQMCQRYYQRGFNGRVANGAYSITNILFWLPFITTMRTAPLPSLISGASFTGAIDRTGTSAVTPNSILVGTTAGINGVAVNFTCPAASFTVGQPCGLLTDIIEVSAEL